MNTPSPKDVPLGEVWEIEPPPGRKGRWIAVRNCLLRNKRWSVMGIDWFGQFYLPDDEIVLRYPYRTETDPVVFKITQSEIDKVNVTIAEDGNVWAGTSLINPVNYRENGSFTAIENYHKPMLCKLFAAQQALDCDRVQRSLAIKRLRQIAPSAGESALSALEDIVPGITQLLAKDVEE